jgi:hypothetical protein
VDLPTLPLPLATVTTCLMPGMGRFGEKPLCNPKVSFGKRKSCFEHCNNVPRRRFPSEPQLFHLCQCYNTHHNLNKKLI